MKNTRFAEQQIAFALRQSSSILPDIISENSLSGTEYSQSSQDVSLTAWLLWFWRNRQRQIILI